MYRFLLTPRWLAAAAITVAASVMMVFLGNWQLHRYEERSAINHRIDAADSAAAVPLTSVRKPRVELGRRAAELLLDEASDADHQHAQPVFEPTLVVRESSMVRRPSPAVVSGGIG